MPKTREEKIAILIGRLNTLRCVGELVNIYIAKYRDLMYETAKVNVVEDEENLKVLREMVYSIGRVQFNFSFALQNNDVLLDVRLVKSALDQMAALFADKQFRSALEAIEVRIRQMESDKRVRDAESAKVKHTFPKKLAKRTKRK